MFTDRQINTIVEALKKRPDIDVTVDAEFDARDLVKSVDEHTAAMHKIGDALLDIGTALRGIDSHGS